MELDAIYSFCIQLGTDRSNLTVWGGTNAWDRFWVWTANSVQILFETEQD